MRTPDAFREDSGYEPDETLADLRADLAREESGRWWPEWAKTAGVKRPAPEHDDDRLF